jgi:hypothetical protein
MSCRCGREFCWDCLTPWEGHPFRCVEELKELEQVELSMGYGSARFDKYCQIALR